MARARDQVAGDLWNALGQPQSPQEAVTQPGLWGSNKHDYSKAENNEEADIKPYVQALTPLDLDSCVRLEELTFPPHERCKRAKFEYRFNECGELCLGLFTSADTTLATASSKIPTAAIPGSAATANTAIPVYSGTPERKAILLGHVIATKTTNLLVRDEDMDIPEDWHAAHIKTVSTPTNAAADAYSLPSSNSIRAGHKEYGRTICIHSLAVLPDFQNRGLGRLLLRAYIQRMQSSGVADRIAIIAHEGLVKFYESFGFESQGPSPVEFGGGGWVDLVLQLQPDDDIVVDDDDDMM